MNNVKLERLQSMIQKELMLILQRDIRNEYCKSLVIHNVKLTNDLSFATIYYSSTLEPDKLKQLEENIEKSKGQMTYQLAQKWKNYKVPKLIFKYDKALEQAQRINDILNKINEQKS